MKLQITQCCPEKCNPSPKNIKIEWHEIAFIKSRTNSSYSNQFKPQFKTIQTLIQILCIHLLQKTSILAHTYLRKTNSVSANSISNHEHKIPVEEKKNHQGKIIDNAPMVGSLRLSVVDDTTTLCAE